MNSRPRVIVQNSISADGRLDWFKGDVGLYYSLAAQLNVDATLTGTETILSSGDLPDPTAEEIAQPKMDGAKPLFLTDSRGRVKCLLALKAQPYFSDLVVLCSDKTPRGHIDMMEEQGIEYIVAGDDKVDLEKALGILSSTYGIIKLRVDSGGTLNGALMRQGLVDEVVLLVNPYAVGGTSSSSWYKAEDLKSARGTIDLKLVRSRRLKGGVQLLHYHLVGH